MATTTAPPSERTDLSIVTSAEQYSGMLARLQDRFNILTPFATIGGLAPQHVVFPAVVVISVDPNAKEVYDGVNAQGEQGLQYLKPGEVALAKNGLRKIAEGLGISIHLEYPTPGIRHYWHVKAIAAYKGVDGQWVI